MRRRHRMSRRGSKRYFTAGAMRVNARNNQQFVMRGGIRM